MIEWLQRPAGDPVLEIGGRTLPVAIRRHPRAKRMTLRLAPDGGEIRVTIPRWGRTQDALAFAHSRSEWLAQQLAALPPPIAIVPGGTIRFRGGELEIDWHEDHPRRPLPVEGAIRLGGPESHLSTRLQRWLETRALELMQDDLAHYCECAGMAAPRLALSRAKRRWGSCSTTGTVRINWRLVQAPDFVRRSVVAHEVAHLVHFDHGREFHALLASLYGERLAEADAWLKEHGRSLYAAFP